MRRYRLARVMTVVLFCFTLFGCAKEEVHPVEITMIHAWGSGSNDHVAMRKIYEDFEKEYPHIKLQLISMPTREEMQRKTEDMIMVGKIPDIVNFSGFGKSRTYDFMVENSMALNLMPYLAKDKELKSTVSEMNLKDWTTTKNQLFTIADVTSLSGGYWYNKDILQNAGIQQLPKTWDQFIEMFEKIQNWSNDHNQEIQAHQVSAEGYLYFMNHLMRDGEHEDESNMDADSSLTDQSKLHDCFMQLRKAYTYSTSASNGYSYLDETSLFNEGKLAIYVNGVWAASMIHSKIPVGYAPIPTNSGITTGCQSSSLGYVLGNSGNSEKEQAAITFIKYMLSEPVQKRILRETDQIPANANVSLEQFSAEKTRLYEASKEVFAAERIISAPEKEARFTDHVMDFLEGKLTEQEFFDQLNIE